MTALPKAILFDLDDTILRFSASGEECWGDVCESYAPRVDGVSVGRLLETVLATSTAYWTRPKLPASKRLDLPRSRREHVTTALRALGVDDADLANEMADRFSATRGEAIRPFAGAVETLAALRDRGVRLGLITNGAAEPQWAKIDRFELAQYFGVIVVEGEFGVGKPDERVYRHAMRELGVTPAETWMVGDNFGWEVEAPQALGITAVWCDHAATGVPAHETATPDRTVTSIAELLLHEGGDAERGAAD
ncbi:phosphoglycolate phosphatase [Candidatus Poribacteria bacterium]|nr:phosphoglycolate phosphatase [Candidatus Poribacteria bacterium]